MGLTFYRCEGCAGVVSWWDIYLRGACPKCGGTRLKPSNLSWWEKIHQVRLHPKVWAWPSDETR